MEAKVFLFSLVEKGGDYGKVGYPIGNFSSAVTRWMAVSIR
ncbi:Uncharacterized protein APZ42_018973 [Daphnia magna]|uniref:Uncharacterized protein n=1 Tax=Daphnia magna TaxID=35525 RepID=A0A164YYA7_9CRUS|nr:Uncharacterized protein APZ42_018973 [Daphnia magna]